MPRNPRSPRLAENGALTLAAVTVLLKELLGNGLAELGVPSALGDVPVTALPPDRVAIGEDERAQLNLYLYRVSPHAVWHDRSRVTGTSASAKRSAANQALELLDLHYLLVAYGAQDFQSEVLLGSAIQVLYKHASIAVDELRKAVAAGSAAALSSPTRAALATAAPDFHAVERLEITPEHLNNEETTKLWNALQAHYRASIAYKVTVVPARAQPA